uniref:Uncharacterized protein n=1 Tax=Anguilla anguilla TaxID=7936 RepID=A0A0E9THR2_ANGAN
MFMTTDSLLIVIKKNLKLKFLKL